jgi:hypothetical protein
LGCDNEPKSRKRESLLPKEDAAEPSWLWIANSYKRRLMMTTRQ